MLSFDVLTIFPEIITEATRHSLLGKALAAGSLKIQAHDLRSYTTDKHRKVDDVPYGGGPGMVLKAEPIAKAVEALTSSSGKVRRILLSPRGPLLTQDKAHEFTRYDQLLLICGRYEGVDERVASVVDEELSIGDYVLAGGEFAALVVIDAVSRLLPGVVGDPESVVEESLAKGHLEYPQYTRPQEFRGLTVPEVLLSGDHQAIRRWREEQAKELTECRRPDLLKK